MVFPKWGEEPLQITLASLIYFQYVFKIFSPLGLFIREGTTDLASAFVSCPLKSG